MKKTTSILVATIIISILVSSCGTIFGGSQYNARVIINDNSNAKIYYKNEFKGTGSASFKVKRLEANKFSITIKENGCKDQTFDYRENAIRGWAVAGTILGWTGYVGGIPIPWGLGLDLATGALIKPNTMENGVSKEDYKNFKYNINYTGCSSQDKWQSNKFDNGNSNNVNNENLKSINANTYTDEVYLKNGGIIKGFIMEQVPSLQMKIQTNDGNIFVYKVDEIQKTISNLNTSCTDIIYLKNGSILKGRIIEEIPGLQVKFQTKDGNIFVYEAERVEKIIREGK
jgi:hypothetical protein